MAKRDLKVPPPGRSASRWLLFLSFYHLLPVLWYMVVAGGFAPGSFLLAAGVASLFAGDSDGFAMAAFLLGPALAAALIFYMLAWLLAVLIGRLQKPLNRSLALLLAPLVSLIAASQPIFVSGGHSSSHSYSMFDFVAVLGEFRISATVSVSYFAALTLLLFGLLVYQHLVARHQAISAQRWLRRRRLRRQVLAGSLLLGLLVFGWHHRTLLFVKPLADLGFASAQYRLAITLKEQSIIHHGRPGGGYQSWLVRAAEQGHLEAALELVRHPRNRKEKLRWLTVSAEGGMADAQYQLYRELLRPAPGVESASSAADWLQRAANNDQPDAQYELGRAYLTFNPALGLEKNPAQARHWWERATDNGHDQAMDELAWRYEKGADGFPRRAQRAIALLHLRADGYQSADSGRKTNATLAADKRARAERLATLEAQLAAGDPLAQAEVSRQLLQVAGGLAETRAEGVRLLERAAGQGDPQLQYELGAIFLFGRFDQALDLPRGRSWWDKALAQNHVKTMEQVAPAYQSGRFDYPVDLLKSKELVSKLVAAYRDGSDGVDPDPARLRRWSDELKYFDRLFELAGGDYQSTVDLQQKAAAGDPQAQYQLGRQMLVSGPKEQRQAGLQWIERAAEAGHAEAQYKLVTYFERQAGIMRNDPKRGVAILTAAARQNHLPAMGTLALGYEKGRYGLERDFGKAKQWYEKLLQTYDAGNYQGEIDTRFIPFNRQRLVYVTQALAIEQEKARRWESASPLEKQIIAIEERYRQQYQDAVNALPRSGGSREDKLKFRAEVQRLLQKYNQLRDTEITKLKAGG